MKSVKYWMKSAEKSVVNKQNVYTGREQRFDNTDCEIQEIILNDHMEAVLITYHSEPVFTITWVDQYQYTLTGEFVTLEELIAMAESVH